ncbi:MAG: ComEC/Rec2 family competence protein [Geminicoccaceae bacterium]
MAHRPLGIPPVAPGLSGLGHRLLPLLAQRSSLWPWLSAQLLEERERWFLWLPVGLGLGILWYFALPAEPPVWAGLAGLLLLAAALAARWRSAPRHWSLLEVPAWFAVGAVVLGFTVATIRTQLVAAPVLERRGAHQLEATVLLVEDVERGQRLTLGQPAIEDIEPKAAPVQVRVSVPPGDLALVPGDRIRLRAMLMPPSAPVEPHGFDFARYAYFMQLGAVGYAWHAPDLVFRADSRSWSLAVSALRQSIASEITHAAPGAAGAVAVALLTGLRGALPEHIWDEWAVAGIIHLLSISGLHMALVAGTVFFAVRIALALAPPLALRLPAKKLAALLALIGAFGYLLISGASVPAVRSFIMTALMLLAVMVDRNPFSMRLVAFAALALLLLQPESLIGASFQMSFAAVVALIAVYETGAARHPNAAHGLDGRLFLYVAGCALTTIVASAATTPFSIYHFSRFSTYGIVANLIAVPLSAIWIMPLGMLGLLLIPFGLADLCFVLMAQGIEIIIAVAAFVADLPGAALDVAQPPLAALIVTVAGGLWLCLWRTPWRRLGLLGIALGCGLMLLARPPDILVDARGQIVAVRLDDGQLAISPWRRDSWITDGWLQTAGQDEAAPWPADGGGDEDLRCDALGCIFSRGGQRIALARRPEALEEDCALADLVISYPRIEHCPNDTPLIGPAALWHAGGIALWIERDGIETRAVREVRGERPWVQAGR